MRAVWALPSRIVVSTLLACCAAVAACGGGGGPGQLLYGTPGGIMGYHLGDGTEKLLLAPVGGNSIGLADPALSPDGKRIAYVHDLPGGASQDPVSDLQVANRDGTDSHMVLQHGGSALRVISPQWSDDLHVLAVIRAAGGGKVTYTLERIVAGTGERTKVLDGVTSFGVSRDRRRIVYTTQAQPGALSVAAIDGSAPSSLMAPGAQFAAVMSPRFSPDGKTVAFTAAAAPSAPLDLYTLPSSGGQATVLAALQDAAPSLTYSGDGHHIYVTTARGLSDVDVRNGGVRKLRDVVVTGAPQWTP